MRSIFVFCNPYRHDGAFRDAVGIGYSFSPMQNLQWIWGGKFYGGAVEGDGVKGLGFEDYIILGFFQFIPKWGIRGCC